MVRAGRAAGCAIGWLASAMLCASCRVDVDYGGTEYRCGDEERCPSGYTCVGDRCLADLPAGFTDDADGGGFELGSFSGTRWADDHVRLVTGRPGGEFVSRVFDSGAEESSWSGLEWMPGAPYRLAFPDDGGAESYRADSADMSENILLLHAELGGALGVDAPLADTSGRDNHPRVVGAALGPGGGVFGKGFADSFTSRLEIDLTRAASAEDFSFGEEDFTWALWLQTTETCLGKDSLGNDTYLGADDDRTTGGAHLWFGCARAVSESCPAGGAEGGRLGGTLISVSGDETDGGGYCGTREITDGAWHHLVLTKSGHAPAAVETWIDGVQDFSGQIMFNAPIVFDAGLPFNIAGEPTPRETAGNFDEIAIWRRGLSAGEVRAAYLRAVRQLEFQVRACEEAECADEPPFVGPGSAEDAFFIDPGGAGPTVEADLDGIRGRYFQYRVTFSGIADPDGSPELYTVRLFLDG